MAKIILLTGSFVAYAYSMEFFIAWYSGNSLREVRVLEPHLWSLLVVLVVWHAFLQLPLAPTFLVLDGAAGMCLSFFSSACA